ncbi:uncharacterized protein LOC134266301 [Saccostrea cucullata]|uniref:uncharacterized protein LOC134266301 n=1 Tax=Saccostrea cuccullata TaxID=36930 RepID=UPI002ED06337
MLFQGKLIFFFSCVLRFVPINGNFGFRNSRRFLDQPSFFSTRSNRVLRRGSLLDSDLRLSRTRISSSPWREVNQRNYLDLSPRTSGRSFRNSWSSSTRVSRGRPLYEMRENRSRRNNIHEILGRQQSGKTSKEVLNSPVINGNEDRWVQRAGTGTVRSRRIEDLLKLMSQNRRADIFNPLKGDFGRKTSAERMSAAAISRPLHVSSRHEQLRRLESLEPVEKKKTSAEKISEPEVKLHRRIITRPKEVRNPNVFLRVRNTPVQRSKIFQSLPMERNHIIAEKKKTSAEKISKPKYEVKLQRRIITRPKEVRNPNVFLRASNTPVQRIKISQSLPMERHIIEEKKKTSAEKVSKSNHRTRLSNKNDSIANRNILLLQRLNTYLRQQLASRKHTNPKQTIQRSKKVSKTSKEILKDNDIKPATKAHVVNAVRTPEPLSSLTQRQHRRSRLLMEPMRFNPHRRRLPQHHRLESSHGIQIDNQIRSNTANSVIKSPVSPQKPLFVVLNPFTGTVGSSTSSIQDKKKDTSKENKSGEKLTWVNP